MALLKLLLKYKASWLQSKLKPAKKEPVVPESPFMTAHYHNPVPVSSHAERTYLIEEAEMQDLVQKVSKDVSLRFEIECALFDHKVGVEDIVFELDESRTGVKFPVARVVSWTTMSPFEWAVVSTDIIAVLFRKDLWIFSVDLVLVTGVTEGE